MPIPIQYTEGPPANPVDPSQTMAILGYCSGAAPSSDPDHPNVIAIDSPGQVRNAAGYGIAPELAHYVSRRGKRRCLLVPCSASTPGVLSSVTQTGQGPIITVAAIDANGPRDDASVIGKVIDAGVAGVGTIALSWSYVLTNGVASPLYQSKITIPERARATVLGTVDLTTLTYAKPAIVTGTVDLTTLTYGPSGDVDGLTLALNKDGAGSHTVTFSAPESAAQIVSQINGTHASLNNVASINQQNKLVLTGVTLGSGGSMVIGSSTGEGVLGLTEGTTNGTAGDLDGLTLTFDDDALATQTVTFSSPKPGSPADVVSKINAATGVTADVYTAMNVLRVRSNTKGSTSTLTITGGTGRTDLGLPLVAATGAESTYEIAHLGITITFSPSTNGSFVANTTYAWSCKAPKMSDADIILRIADLVRSGYPFGAIYIAGETDVTSSLARAQMLDAQMTALHQADAMKRAAFGLDPSESDANVKSTFTSFRSAWVDLFARGAYVRGSSNIPGSGNILRSSAFAGAMADTFLPLYKDRGDHGITYEPGIVGLPDVDGITSDEASATTKLVGSVQAAGISFNVPTKDVDGGYYFSGGYSAADGTSKYCDSSVRNTMLRVGEIAASVLSRFVNDTDLDTNEDETLSDSAAELVNSAIETAVSSELVPSALQAVNAQVDQTERFYSTKKLSATVTGYNRVPARSVAGVVGPGIVTNG